MNEDINVSADEVINDLTVQIGAQARELAILRSTIKALQQRLTEQAPPT